MKVWIPNAEIVVGALPQVSGPSRGVIGFKYSFEFSDSIRALLELAANKGINQLSVELQLPYRKRSSGFRSQNSRLHGHCKDIATQLMDTDSGEPTCTAEEVKEAMKRKAVEEGYPTKWSPIDGEVIPLPTRQASVEEMQIILDVVQRFADEHELWLHEYDLDGVPYRSVGGRSREEMERYRG